MEEFLGSSLYLELKSKYMEAIKKVEVMDSEVTTLVDIQDMTTAEQLTFIHELRQIAELYPEQEEETQVQRAIKTRIITERKTSPEQHKSPSRIIKQVPDIITVQTPVDNDDDHSSYPSFSSRSKGNKKHKVKLRAKFGDKILWDGRRTTFRPLEDLIIGHLLQVNGSYMVSPIFLDNYSKQGDTYLGSHEFKATFYTSHVQAQYDKRYFYGILRSVPRAGGAGRKHVLRYQQTQDGFLTWKDMLKDCENDGSTMLRVEKLKSIVNQPYSKKYPGGLAAYIERLQLLQLKS